VVKIRQRHKQLNAGRSKQMTLVNGIQTLSNHPYRHVDHGYSSPWLGTMIGGGIDVTAD